MYPVWFISIRFEIYQNIILLKTYKHECEKLLWVNNDNHRELLRRQEANKVVEFEISNNWGGKLATSTLGDFVGIERELIVNAHRAHEIEIDVVEVGSSRAQV